MTEAPFYRTFAGNPHFNMAFDEWLLARAIRQPGWTAFRLYTWERPAITFGVNQRAETAVDFARLGETPAIRRITGGRALLHDPSELTYCVVAGRDPGCAAPTEWISSATDFCREVASGLVRFLAQLGIDAELVRRSSRENTEKTFFHRAPCFASHARFEIVGRGGKLVASSARVLGNAALVHGAIKIGGVGSHPALPSLSGGQVAAHEELEAVSEARFRSYGEVFARSLRGTLGCDLTPTDPARGELEQLLRAEEFVRKNEWARRPSLEQITL